MPKPNQTKPNQTKPNQTTKAFIVLITLAFALGVFTPALADYLGPDRTVTTASEVCKVVLWECMYVPAKDEYRYRKADEWSCASEGKEWQSYDSVGPECGAWSNGRTYWSREYTLTTVTITHPEATVNSELQNCALQNGWCVTPPQLALTANEPLSGHGILLIEGTRNAEAFACEELQTNCTIPLLEGINTLEYWALSSWGDSSRKGTMSVNVDTVPPNLNLLVNGALGQNNWYVSNTTITAEGTDDTSGIYEKALSIDKGNTWIPSTTLSDGIYTVDIKITDNAYNISTASTTIQVDTTTPTLSLSVTGTKGNNNYYVSKPKVTATTFDATSGIALVQAKIDNGNWIDTNEITIADGIHTYQFRVYDNAGNVTESSIQNIKVDTTPPIVEADEEINLGDTLFFTLRDNGSGLWIERIVIENEDEKYKKIVWLQEISGNKIEGDILWDGKFADKTLAAVGEYYITFKISDRAGNETFYTTVVNVNPISYLQVIPEFIPPVSDEIASNELPSNESEQSFGGTNNTPTQPSEAQTLISLTGTATAGVSTNTTSTSNILWGTAAAAVIGMAAAYALEQQKKREEEEAAQLAQAQAEVDAKNAAMEAQQLAMREQLKIRNWLIGQQIKKAQEAAKDKYGNLSAAEAEMGRGIPAAPYAPLGYVDEEEIKWLEEGESQRAWESYRAGEGASYDGPPPTPIPACTPPPTPQTFIGPAPTSTPTPTPMPSLSAQDLAHGVCEAADMVDPIMPDPATVGGPDVGDLIDQLNTAMQSVPPSNPIIATAKFFVGAVETFRKVASTPVNIVCQQWERKGPYYDIFPIDKHVADFARQWNQMSTLQKVAWGTVTVLLIATTVALILSL